MTTSTFGFWGFQFTGRLGSVGEVWGKGSHLNGSWKLSTDRHDFFISVAQEIVDPHSPFTTQLCQWANMKAALADSNYNNYSFFKHSCPEKSTHTRALTALWPHFELKGFRVLLDKVQNSIEVSLGCSKMLINLTMVVSKVDHVITIFVNMCFCFVTARKKCTFPPFLKNFQQSPQGERTTPGNLRSGMNLSLLLLPSSSLSLAIKSRTFHGWVFITKRPVFATAAREMKNPPEG